MTPGPVGSGAGSMDEVPKPILSAVGPAVGTELNGIVDDRLEIRPERLRYPEIADPVERTEPRCKSVRDRNAQRVRWTCGRDEWHSATNRAEVKSNWTS